LGVRSLDGSGPHTRGVDLVGPVAQTVPPSHTAIGLLLRNTGTAAATDPDAHPADVSAYLDADIYRLEVSIEGEGWTAELLNALTAVPFESSRPIAAYVSHDDGSAATAILTVRATSESDPTKRATATVQVMR
jgi:hypothetical protein